MRPEVEFWSAWLYTMMRGYTLGNPPACLSDINPRQNDSDHAECVGVFLTTPSSVLL